MFLMVVLTAVTGYLVNGQIKYAAELEEQRRLASGNKGNLKSVSTKGGELSGH